MALLELRGIHRSFGATVALDGVDLSVEPGEIHALVGENGSGKSTLMRIAAGALAPDSGEMLLDGEPYRPATPAAARAAGVAMVYQELTLCSHLSVLDNLTLGLEPVRFGFLRHEDAARQCREALAPLGLAEIDLDAPAGSFPIAVRQLIEIGRAAVLQARVVILDEPTSSLTEADVQRLFQVIRTLKARGCGVIYISHFLNEIREIADRLTVLRDGHLIGVRPVAEVSDAQIVTMVVGRSIEELYPRTERNPGEVLLEVTHLAGRKLPKDASLTVRRGEVLGIAGLNGSGRTELVRTIFGLDPITSGQVSVRAITGPASPHRRWNEGVGMLSEDRKGEGLALNLSIADNITLSSLPGGWISDASLETESQQWIGALAIKVRNAGQAAGELSGGNQQKVALARLLEHGVDLLLLDEPTRGIDVGSKEQIYRLIDRCAQEGKAVLMVSSYLPELLGVCDRIAVMRRGELGPARAASGLTQEDLLEEAVGAAV
jgi:ribose transport system ATP-binding protein